MKRLLLMYLVMLFTFAAHAQDRVVTGTVTSVEDGSPIPGANVVQKGTSNGTVTASDGTYRIAMQGDGGILVFSFIGMITSEQSVGTRAVVDITLGADVKQLSEVIITSMGLKEDPDKFASSVSTVKGSQIAKSGETGVLQGLAGKTAGVLITKNGGDPGAGAYIQIRGQNTINGNAQPLFIVDGVPVNNSNEYTNPFSGGQLSGAGNSIVTQSRINDINPEDIASMEVLKGASAAALWGTRAANGVIIITTKKGKDTNGKVNISLKSTVSFDEVNKIHALQTTFGNGTDGHYAFNNRNSWGDRISDRTGGADVNTGAAFLTFADGTVRRAVPSGSGTYWDGTNATNYGAADANAHGGKNSRSTYDHTKDVFQTGHFVDNNLTISGGNAKSNFLMSYSNLSQQGVIKNFSDYTRNSARINASSQFTDWFRGSASASYMGTYSTRAQTGDNLDGLMLGGLRTPPDFNNALYLGTYTDASGTIFPNQHVAYRDQLGASDHPVYSNPLWNINNNKNTTQVDRFIGNLELTADPTSWLSLTGRAGVDYFTDKNNELFPLHSATFPTGYFQVNNTTEKQVNLDFFARAAKTFNEKFSGSLLVGVNYNDRFRETDHAQITDFTISAAPTNLNNGLNSNLQAYTYKTHIRSYAYYAQADFQALDQLFLTLTGRSESASTFANSFFFPSAALAWQFTKLDGLVSDGSFLSFGKLRATWGQVGIQPQPYLAQTIAIPGLFFDSYAYGLQSSSSVFGGGFGQNNLAGNPNLKPELKTEFELGADLRFLENRLTLAVTAYSSHTDDVILNLNLPSATGFDQQPRNAAKIENKGLEIEVGYDVIKKGNFTWNISGNWAANRNKVVSLAGSAAQTVPGNGTYAGQSLIEGQPFGVFYGAVLQHDEKGKYILDNGFPVTGTASEVYGNPNPMWRSGLGTTFGYKGLTLYVMFDKVFGNDFWNGTRGALNSFGVTAETGNVSVSAVPLKTWDGLTIPAGTSFRGNIHDFGGGPVALTQSWYQNTGTSFGSGNVDLFKEDGGSTRLREVTMAYSIRGAGFRKATKLSSIDISVTGRNLALWTNYTGVDPESNITGASLARGSDWFISPSTRSVLFTVKITY